MEVRMFNWVSYNCGTFLFVIAVSTPYINGIFPFLFRNMFHDKKNTDAIKLAQMVEYVRRQMQHLDSLNSKQLLTTGMVEWLPFQANNNTKASSHEIAVPWIALSRRYSRKSLFGIALPHCNRILNPEKVIVVIWNPQWNVDPKILESSYSLVDQILLKSLKKRTKTIHRSK